MTKFTILLQPLFSTSFDKHLVTENHLIFVTLNLKTKLLKFNLQQYTKIYQYKKCMYKKRVWVMTRCQSVVAVHTHTPTTH